MSQQVIAKIELENGKQITHYSSLGSSNSFLSITSLKS